MSKDSVLSFIRYALMVVGAYLLGSNIMGSVVDSSLWEQLVGCALSLVGIIWSFCDKTSTLEGFQSVIRKVLVFAGGLLLSAGKLTDSTLEAILGMLTVAGPMLYSWLSRLKTKGIADGSIKVDDLKGGS